MDSTWFYDSPAAGSHTYAMTYHCDGSSTGSWNDQIIYVLELKK
jgi:hypothetical protein